MLSRFLKAFTLVEMLVALAVSSIIIAATYASYEMVATQYKKNMDVADMHTSGRAIMRIIERDIRMAGFEYRDKDAKVTYGSISSPLTIKDSDNKCCDEVTVIYDYFDEESKKAERIRIKYWAGPHTSNKGSRYRLYKQKDILGQNKKILAKPKLGNKEVMADYIEDLQFSDANAGTSQSNQTKQSSGYIKIDKDGAELSDSANKWSCAKDKKTGLIWEVKTNDGGLRDRKNNYNWYDPNPATNKGYPGKSTKPNTYSYSKNINSLKLCGNDNWRLPTIKELCTIRDNNQSKSPYINTNYFPNTVTGYIHSKGNVAYKTSTTYDNPYLVRWWEPKHTWVVLFNKLPSKCTIGNSISKYNPAICCVRLVSKRGKTGTIELVGISLTLRTKNQYGKDRQFKKKDYHAGNYKLDKTDKYKRDTFSSTVLVRNLAL